MALDSTAVAPEWTNYQSASAYLQYTVPVLSSCFMTHIYSVSEDVLN